MDHDAKEPEEKLSQKPEETPRGILVMDFDGVLYFPDPMRNPVEGDSKNSTPCAREFTLVFELLQMASFKIINGSQRLLLQVDNILGESDEIHPHYQEQIDILDKTFPDRSFMLASDAELIATPLMHSGEYQAQQLTDMREHVARGDKTAIIVALNRYEFATEIP